MLGPDVLFAWLRLFDDGGKDDPELPPGSPPTQKFDGPWFRTQITISLTLGLFSFLVFSYCRTRWPLVFAPRTKLKGFSPHEAHAHQAFFGWIIPTIRTSEFTVLQIVGLDAAVLLNFFKMSFLLFSTCSMFAILILMPINWKNNLDVINGDDDGDDDWPPYNSSYFLITPGTNTTSPTPPGSDWLDLISEANSYLTVHLIFTYIFTLLALRFVYKNYMRFIRSRQLFSLELVHSIPARTVMVTNLPAHLQSERAIAEYYENMDLAVESVSLCREVAGLKELLDKRTEVLMKLESAWVKYVGNPSTVESYDPSDSVLPEQDPSQAESQRGRLVVPHRPRPTMRLGWFKSKVDAIEHLDSQFVEADDAVKRKRRTGKFKPTHVAFVTFEKMSSAQIAIQTTTSSHPIECKTYPAPEPRDIVWTNMGYSTTSIRIRELVVLGAMGLLFSFWVFPTTALASLLSYQEIKKVLPWLGNLIDSNDQIRAIVQNSLPSFALILLNASLPFLLEALTYVQGYKARSWIEYSLLRKYFLFLLVNVVFIFLLASTYVQLVRDLANSPAKIPERIATALQRGNARHFFLSYVILQGIGIMPLQLLNLGVIVPQLIMRMFYTRTPRDFAELNAPPMINYGTVYPQAILIFVVTILYSVVQPLILPFGAIYFGVAYVVYKYKLLFVFYKPYESQGQAWPLTFIRLIWGVVIFLVFMIGIFTLKGSYVLPILLLPLLGGTVLWSWYMHKSLKPLSKYVSLSSVFEVERGQESADVMQLRAGHPVTWSQSNLNRRRYAQNDDTLYVAPEDERTDYSQPPMANWYAGVLNTGKRRYGHPALNGVLPTPWLPLKKGQTLANGQRNGASHGKIDANDAVVLTLRKRNSLTKRSRRVSTTNRRASASNLNLLLPELHTDDNAPASAPPANASSSDPWQDGPHAGSTLRSQTMPGQTHHQLTHRLSYDHASGIIMLPDDSWLDDEDRDSDSDYGSTPSPASGPEVSIHEGTVGMQHQDPTNLDGAGVGSGTGANRLDALPDAIALERQTSSSSAAGGGTPHWRRRYATYFHRPERRRQQPVAPSGTASGGGVTGQQ